MSVIASLFGVQSHANYQRDFTQTSVAPFIIVGVVLVAVLVITLALLVSWLVPV
ncbi:DUF2970 domain-containing protein [Alteromonas oceanisediminis]|uniref:DUF2970 domain-containing protein n=1 Tax=Alteromonas oceanisediminis TaxID=2836180 RepID=UPI0028F4602E|nr:DUF2970 domain-containing protein [Alteromonas oceanisediminis]